MSKEKHVLLVDDILDTGNTMERVSREVLSKKPASLQTCVFLDKPERRQNGFRATWSGFSIPDEFVVGYGLDYAGQYRQLPFVGTLKPAIYENPLPVMTASTGNPLRKIYDWTLSLSKKNSLCVVRQEFPSQRPVSFRSPRCFY